MKVRVIKRRNGKTVRIPVDDDGYVPYDELLKHNMERSAHARAMDARQVSKTVHSPLITPEEAASWWANPGRSDIYGVDARKVEPPRRRERPHYNVPIRPKNAPPVIPLGRGGFVYYKEWYTALGDATFVEKDAWGTYWYMVDARQGKDYCRVYFKIPWQSFRTEKGPIYNENFNWGGFVDQFDWVPRDRWKDRPKGYAMNFSVKEGRRGR